MIYLNVEEIIDYHTEIINEFGGAHGIRDIGLLISAVEIAKAAMFGDDLHKTVFDKAAAYLFHLICNHPFIDGNKRIGTVAALTFLNVNNIVLKFIPEELEELVVNVAQGKIKKEEIASFFEKSFEMHS